MARQRVHRFAHIALAIFSGGSIVGVAFVVWQFGIASYPALVFCVVTAASLLFLVAAMRTGNAGQVEAATKASLLDNTMGVSGAAESGGED